MNTSLSEAQKLAILHVNSSAGCNQSRAEEIIASLLQKNGISAKTIRSLYTSIRMNARATLNFHPDRMSPTGRSVIESLLSEGIYHNQFITSVTNGSRTAYPGGDRDRWEQLLFGGAYQLPGVQNEERPKYGALNLMNYADGASPRFGSCYFVLSPRILERCTFTFGDSHTGPESTGTFHRLESILAALLLHVDSTGSALGAPEESIPSILDRLHHLPPFSACHTGPVGRSLDDYIEAQIHGDIDLSRDVEALGADPSYRDTPIGHSFQKLCEHYGLRLSWHPGFSLAVNDVPDDFRGPAMPPLAQRIDRIFGESQGSMNAAILGKAAADLHGNPGSWSDWGTYDETFQHLKQLWHVLVRYGHPNRASR